MSSHSIRLYRHVLRNITFGSQSQFTAQPESSHISSRLFSTSQCHKSKLQVGDRILLRWIQGKNVKTKLTKPLREDGETLVDSHVVKHAEIIGKESDTRFWKISEDGLRKVSVSARHPSLDEFTSLAPRRVAPIYAAYASTIVSLLDLHVSSPSSENDPELVGGPSLQILEAGTGQGGLTIQLSRAIAAANPPCTRQILPQPSKSRIYKHGEESDDEVVPTEAEIGPLRAWRNQRRAVIHTVDIDKENRLHADQLLRTYRGGMYWPHVNFNAGNVREWVERKLAATEQRPFLDSALLDMPSVETYIEPVIQAVKDRGRLVVFVPQITQIAACVQQIVNQNLGLRLEKVIELGDGVSTGRLWDVRMANVRNAAISKQYLPDEGSPGASDDATKSSVASQSAIPPMVCRPIVGELTRGGGFVAVWKKVAKLEDGVSD